MSCSTYAFQVTVVRSPVLTSYLRRSEAMICGTLCRLVHIIFWAIALLGFVLWGLWRLIHGFIWLITTICRITIRILDGIGYIVSELVWIVWVILVWIGGLLYRIVIVLIRCLHLIGIWLWRMGCVGICWSLREFGEPAICTFVVYLGVLSTSLLPIAVLLQLVPSALIGLALPPLTAFAIAVRVFDNRAYRRWQSANRVRLGVRLLRAYSDGITWSVWLLRK